MWSRKADRQSSRRPLPRPRRPRRNRPRAGTCQRPRRRRLHRLRLHLLHPHLPHRRPPHCHPRRLRPHHHRAACAGASDQPPPPAPPCKYEVGPSSQSVTAKGGEFSLTVTTAADCKWSVSSSPSWIAVRSGSGAGDGQVTYVVSANEGSARTGRIEVASTTVTISQEPLPRPACKYGVSPSSQSVSAKGGEFSLTVKTAADCKWSASSSPSWISHPFRQRRGGGPRDLRRERERRISANREDQGRRHDGHDLAGSDATARADVHRLR